MRIAKKLEIWIVVAVSAITCSILAIYAGQDINWDQLNYYVYGVFALFNDRSANDIAPSGLQSWFNPAGEVIQYYLTMYWPPIYATVALALIASLSMVLAYLIANEVFLADETAPKSARLFFCWAALIGSLSPMFITEVGTTFNDTMSSIFIFCALFAVMNGQFSAKSFAVAGLAIGLALDVKLTNSFFVMAWVLTTVVIMRRESIRAVVYSGLGALLTYLPIGGAWNAYTYYRTGNPIFPIYNNIFESPLYRPVLALDLRFRPEGLAEALAYFPKWALGLHSSSELNFVDIRFLIILILLVLILPRLLVWLVMERSLPAPRPLNGKPARFLVAFCLSSFFFWISAYGIQRYLMPVEQLAVLVLLVLLFTMQSSAWSYVQTATMAVLAIMIVQRPVDFGHFTFEGSWFNIRLPEELKAGGDMFVIVDGDPLAYLIAFLPEDDKFVRIGGNLPLDPERGLGLRARAMVQSHSGPIRTLVGEPKVSEQGILQLRQFGLSLTQQSCVQIEAKHGVVHSCLLARD